MPDLDALFLEVLAMLREARQTVGADVEAQASATALEPETLGRLANAIRSFAEQADGLLNLMIERDPLNPEIEEAEELLQFFYQAEMRVEMLLAAGRG